MDTVITPESTLLRRLTHGKMSRALCLEAADRIEELEKAKTEAYSEIRLMAAEIEALKAQLDAVLDTEVPFCDGKVKIRQFSQVKRAIQQKQENE